MIFFIDGVGINTEYMIGFDSDVYNEKYTKVQMTNDIEYVVPVTTQEFRDKLRLEMFKEGE